MRGGGAASRKHRNPDVFFDDPAMTGLERMTTAEIAAAIDAREYWRSPRYRLLSVARKGALSWFLFQYLLLFRVDPLWTCAIVVCALIVELRMNRFTMKTYGTHEIVDLLMKRSTLHETRTDFLKKLAAGFVLWLSGVVTCLAGASFYTCHVVVFAGMLSMLLVMKSADQIQNAKYPSFDRIETEDGGFHLQVRRRDDRLTLLRPWDHPILSVIWFAAVYGVLAAAKIFPIAVFALGGIEIIKGEQHLVLIVTIVFSMCGCVFQEPVRFHRVSRELDRLEARGAGVGT